MDTVLLTSTLTVFPVLYLSSLDNSLSFWCGYPKAWFPWGCSQLPRICINDSECLVELYVHSTQNYKSQAIVDSQLKKFWSRFPDSTCKRKWTNPFVYIDLIKGEFVSLNCIEQLRQFFMETHTEGRVTSELHMNQLYSLTSGCLSISVSHSDSCGALSAWGYNSKRERGKKEAMWH